MVGQRVYRSRAGRGVPAPAGVVYGMLADAARWPLLLPAPLHVERIDFDGTRERLRLWDLTTAGHVRSSHLHRTLDPHARTLTFRQEDLTRPHTPTTGTWTVHPDGDTRTRLTLHQEHTAEALTDPAHHQQHAQHDTDTLLGQLTAAAAGWEHLDGLLLAFEDSLHLDGPPELVYDFLHRIADWPARLPHIDHADVREDTPGIQLADLHTTTPDGRPATTRTARLCFPAAARIVFKELHPPAPLAAHTGEWTLTPHHDGTRATCTQQILLRPTPHTTAAGHAETRRQIRTRLSATSLRTLRLADWRARTAVRRLRSA
ncbi:SRPBCC family protein [Streptomyces sp. NPDC047014]|uniref:SRPBCC family protein n=1 Tax=Streptomyces sp. NPDC047014 TaxID=3155736 RepID=UPI0033D40A4E